MATKRPAAEYEELPEPIIVEGWAYKTEGAIIEGTVCERSFSDFGPYYKIRLSTPALANPPEGKDDPVTMQVGQIIAISETAKMRPIAEKMKKHPVAVRMEFQHQREGKKGWEMSVKVRAAF